jgi:hypothetical protein
MWVILLRVRVGGIKRVNLFLPIPLFVILEFADMLDDLSCFIRLFDRRAGKDSPAAVMSSAAGIVKEVTLDLIYRTGILDLADIEIMDEKTEVMVKCMLR